MSRNKISADVAAARAAAERRDRADLRAGRYDILCARYFEAVMGTARSILWYSEADSQDAVSITWERLLREWHRGKVYRAPVAAVVVTVAKWESRDVAKRAYDHNQKMAKLNEAIAYEAPNQFAHVEAIDWMESLFGQLPPREREVMEMRYLEDMPPAHIAEYLGIEPNAVHQAQHRAVRAMRLIESA